MGIKGIGIDSDTFMWHCEACLMSFPRTEILTDYYPATRYEPSEMTLICPECGAEDFLEEAPYECACCGEYFPGHKMSEVEEMCQECHDSARQRLNKAVEAMEDETILKLWRDMQEVYNG